ncbi:cytochrome P450 [Streptomyces longispororuber]|uniref:Cytochrome P450 n=1 Tax=Streptomyces longispororuber TaxID=68230 RepID=A0A918ZZ80_9ACTN|nr:cytochrome P450 [Streptomyces longispororuber]GHE79061.1 cytochrome P450 [Streptomyces longispororuber]
MPSAHAGHTAHTNHTTHTNHTAHPHHTAGTPPGAWPLAGHAAALARAPLDVLASLPEYGDLVELRIMGRRLYFPCHPDLVWQVLTDDRTFDRTGPVWTTTRRLLGNGLALRCRQDHRGSRRAVQPSFHPTLLRHQATLVQEEIAATTAGWRDHQHVDLYSALVGTAVRTITRALFSSRVPREAVEDLQRHALAAIDTRLWRLAAPGPLHGLGLSRLRRFTDKISDLRRTGDATADDGIVARLEQAMPAASDRDIAEEVVSLYLGATDTSALAVCWALHLLTRHPAEAHRLHRELDGTLRGRGARYGDLPGLPRTGQVIAEALRLYPPAWFVLRCTTRPVELAGKHLPTGSTVVVCPAAVHRNPALYEDPAAFVPDRWLPDRAAPRRGAYVPFGAGARKCVAEHFGTAQAVLTLATLVHLWDPRATARTDGRPAHFAAMLKPRRFVLEVHARPREHRSGVAHGQVTEPAEPRRS